MWGYPDPRTKMAKHYVINNNNWFTRLYKRYGDRWAELVQGRKWLHTIISPIWKYMAEKGREYYANPTGYPNIKKAIAGLKEKYPDMFDYYLIGSNARNEQITHYYDIQIVPTDAYHDLAVWEDVLKTLYYVQEADERWGNPNISPQFAHMKDYNGKQVYAHRDDMIDCFFYYDKKFPKNFHIESIKGNDCEPVEQIYGNVWSHRTKFIGDKWRVRGLDKLPYAKREIK